MLDKSQAWSRSTMNISLSSCAGPTPVKWSLDFWISACLVLSLPESQGVSPETFSHWLGSCLHPDRRPAMGLTSNIPVTQRCSPLCHTHIQNLSDSSWIKFQFPIPKCGCKWSVVWTRLGTVHKRISSKKVKRLIPRLTPVQEHPQ